MTRRVKISALLMSVAAAIDPAFAGTVVENFTTNTTSTWDHLNNTVSPQNYGWRNTNNTGTAVNPPGGTASGAGELGGTIARDGSPAHFYGYDIGALNLNNAFQASGVVHNVSSGGSYLLGYYRGADSFIPNESGPKDFIGFLLDDGVGAWAMVYQSDGSGDYAQTPELDMPIGQTVPFSMYYNPIGSGTLTLNVNGNSFAYNLEPGVKNGVLDFTHFGILGVSLNGNAGERYWDDFRFTTSAPSLTGSEWNTNSDGDFLVSGNWIDGVPNGIGAQATFGPIITDIRLVYAHEPMTLGKVNFSGQPGYLLDGAGSLSIQVGSGTGLIDVQNGTQKINLPLTIASDTNLAVASGATLKISDPVTVMANRNLTQSGAGLVKYEATVTLEAGADIEFGNSSYFAALNMASGAFAQVSSDGQALMVDALSLAGTAKLDLMTNDLIVDHANGGDYAAIQAKVILGFNAGNWMGNGITSSSAANDTNFVTALGIVDNAEIDYSVFAGFTGLDGDEILVKYTYYGDADLGGTVNNDDFVQFLAGYNEGAPAKWLNGDFDYNSSVNLDDFALFLAGLQEQDDPRVSPELFANLAEFVGAEGVDVDLSSVPEPSAAALLALAPALLTRRRRHR